MALLLVAGSGQAQAYNSSAWTRPKNELWALLSYGSIVAGDQFLVGGGTDDFIQGLDETTFVDESFYTQFAFGLEDWLTLSLELPFKRINIRRQRFDTFTEAFGDMYFGVRLGILELLEVKAPVVWSAEMGVQLPTGYTRNLTPSVGAGNIVFDLKTTVGAGFNIANVLPVYTQGGIGFRARSTAFALSASVECPSANEIDCVLDQQPRFGDELLFLTELGVTPFNGALLAFGKVMGEISLQEPRVGFTTNNPIPVRQRNVKVGGGMFVYPFRFFQVPYAENIGLAAQYYSMVWGENTPKTDMRFIGIEYTQRF